MPLDPDRDDYAAHYGPALGDGVRLADTAAVLELELIGPIPLE